VSRFVTDTHPLIWYAQSLPRKLGRRARRAFEKAEAGQVVIYVPSMVLVESLELVRRGMVKLRLAPQDWFAALFDTGGFVNVDLTRDVVLAAHELYAIPERSDRLIAATARSLGLPLITRDPAIGAAGVEVVW
jgi:PIN domain nuclease of toxin-antitoxin system